MLEHLTADARRAVVLAADEAREMGHGHIGTEHLLLGLVRLGDPATAALGMTLSGARAGVRGLVGNGRGARTIGELRFSSAAKRALERADAEGDGDGAAGPGSLLVALLRDGASGASKVVTAGRDDGDALLALVGNPRGVSARALALLGIDQHKLGRAIDEVRGSA